MEGNIQGLAKVMNTFNNSKNVHTLQKIKKPHETSKNSWNLAKVWHVIRPWGDGPGRKLWKI
jgi:hypothetical protein